MVMKYFSNQKTKWFKKVISVVSILAIIFSVIAVPLAVHAQATTEKMFVIAPNATGESKYANVIIPLDFTEAGGVEMDSQAKDDCYYFKLSFKLKLLDSTKMPIVGVVRYAYWNGGGQSEFNYVNNNQDSHSDTILYSQYDEDTLMYTAVIKTWVNPHPDTGVHTVLTIGNMEHNNNWHKENNFDANFAFTSPELYAYDTETGETFGDNLLPEINESNFTGEVYKHPQNGYTGSDSLLNAPANKWSIDTTSSLISLQDIPDGYFAPNPHKYIKVPIQLPTNDTVGYKEHYICECEECEGKYFLDSKGNTEVTLKDLEIASLGEDKVVVISPNIEGETNFANVFIPINFREAGNGVYLKGNDYYFKLTFKARVFGDKLPIVSVIRYNPYDNLGSYSEPAQSNNNQESHKDQIIYSTYNEDTMTFEAVVKVWINDNYCTSPTGAYAAIMIGNAEHNNTWYKENNFDTYFAFSNPELYYYNTETKEAEGQNLINPITESTMNFDTVYQHPKNDYNGEDNIMAAPANMWSIDGDKNLISVYDYPEDYFTPGVHNYVEMPAKAPTRTEKGYLAHYSCDCEHCKDKYFSDQGLTEVSAEDIEIPAIGEDKVVVVSPNVEGATNFANVFIPINFREAGNGVYLKGNDYYFKLTFKARVFGDKLPIVSVIRYNPYDNLGSYSEPNNSNNNQEAHSDQIIYSTYNEDTMTFEAVVKVWINDNYCTSPTGAYAAIMIGNAEHNNTWYKENNFDTYFAFSNPELYYYNTETKEAEGQNLINPIAESTMNFDTVYQHPKNDYNGEDNIMAAPANMWSIDGDKNLVSVYDYPEDYFTPGVHNYVEHPAKEATESETGNITYYTCDCENCAGKYFSDYGFTEIEEESIFTTKKMIIVSPNSSGGTKFANAFIPLNFRESGGVTFKGNDYYFKLTFKVKLLGSSLPIVGMMRYNPYDNLGSWSEPSLANNNQLEHKDQVLYTEYDPETMIFTAVVRTWINDNYCTSPTGAHTAITIGNAEHNGNWYSENNFDASFAFCDPKLYAYDAETGETYGENLIADITDSTFNSDKVYQHLKNDYNGEDNIMAAPANMWSVDGQGNMVTLSDIPADYFVPVEGTPQMVMFAGSNDSEGNPSGGNIFQKVALQADKSYVLSYNAKYAGTGMEGDKIGGELQYATSDGIKVIDAQKTVLAEEYKEIFKFTMPSDAKGGNNFTFTFNYSSAFTSGYMANFELYELDANGNPVGKNLFKNGDFSVGGTTMWNKQGSTHHFVVTDIPENFFNKANPAKSNMIIYRNTSDYAQFLQMLMIKPGTTYEFSHTALHTDYASDKKPYSIVYEFYYNDNGKVENDSIPDERVKQTVDGAKTKMVFTTKENLRVTGESNSIFRLYMRSDSAGYWGPVELYELDKNGNRVGNNLMLNSDFIFGTTAWQEIGDKTARIVEIPDGFFENYEEPQTMVYSNGSADNQIYSDTIEISADKTHYFTGYYVNMNSVGVTPEIEYLSNDGTFKKYSADVFYDSSRYYFEITFDLPEDALVTDGKVTIRAQINNTNKGKGYFTNLMLSEEGKYINLIGDFAYESNGNYDPMKYDSEVFVFYYDDTKFDDGDWSGELASNTYDISYGTISGRVIDNNGNALPNITLKLMHGNITVTTDANGSFFFNNLTPAQYKLYLVQKDNTELLCMDINVKKGMASLLPAITYYIDVKTVSVDNNDIHQEQINPEETPEYGVLRGFYYTKRGKTISNGEIFLRGYGSVKTDKTGMFMFENIVPGEYELYTVLDDGTEYIFRTVNIEPNKGIQVKIMEPILEENNESNPWLMVLIIGGSVVVCAGVILFIVLFSKKKK